MAAKLTLFPARGASRRLLLRDGETRQAGRDPGANDFVLDDPPFSAQHARLAWTGCGRSLQDLGSKNGTLVAGSPAEGGPLEDEAWVSFGGLRARFELVAVQDVEELENERSRRIQTSVGIQGGLAGERDARVL